MTFRRIKTPEINDLEYILYLRNGYVLRFCYGCNAATNYLLQIIEIAATGTGTFIVLLENAPSYLVAIMLITAFISSSVRNALNLKYSSKAYARAFRILEFALDEYRISNKTKLDKEQLIAANKKAQAIIEEYV